ncbi:MAG: substrate-binding domain-containing protein [Chloroflexi bacterium]|nr:substrate-binding domain-containing protein [Chloroflexota bacterium]
MCARRLIMALACSILLGCGYSGEAATAPDPLAGQYTGSGGGGALPQVRALTERFSELHPGVVWLLDDVGSEASIKLVAAADIDVGFISRDLKKDEVGKVELLPIGAAGTAVVVNAENRVEGLTREQTRQIFTGEISDWSQVGGAPGRIRVLLREKESSTRSTFEGYFFDAKPTYAKDAIEVYEIDETLKAIYSFKDAIGMATLSDRTLNDPQLRMLAVDGVAATKAALASGDYQIRRPLYLISNPDQTKLKPGVRAFLEFVGSPEGQQLLAGL